MYDVAIIGAGVIGTGIARELMKYQLKVVVIERTNDVAGGTSKANSAIVHAGYDAPLGSKKAYYNKKGSEMYEGLCQELDVHYKRVGSFVVGFSESDRQTLQNLKDNGDQLGIKDLEIVDRDFILSREPNISEEVQLGLYAPTAAITDPFGLTIAFMENAMDNGAELMLNYLVTDVVKKSDHYDIKNKDQHIQAKVVINAAGLFSDDIIRMIDPKSKFTIKPRRGQYYLLDKTAKDHVNSVIFQCPNEKGKGVLIAPTVDGNILVGPDSEDLSEEDKNAIETTSVSLAGIKVSALKAIKNIPYHENITSFSGLRAEPSIDDFLIGEYQPGFYNVAGIKSPGLSAAPAIALDVADEIARKLDAKRNGHHKPTRSYVVNVSALSIEEKQTLIKSSPLYGRIICRCENITEGEIIDAINRNCGGKTVNGIKRRVRPGAGRCQGGFCMPRVVEILSRELKTSQSMIVKENIGSNILIGRTKEGK